jgi:DNA-binding transcriptional LysR family regulator
LSGHSVGSDGDDLRRAPPQAPPAENTAEKQRVRQQMLARNWHDDAISSELGSFCQKSHLIAGIRQSPLRKPRKSCDLVFRFGLPNDPGMVARKMAMTIRVLCAAPSYLTHHGTPHSPDDLLQHNCLRLARRHYLDDLWRFRRDGSEFEVRVRGKLSSGDGAVLHEWALSGEGISWEALWDVSDDLASGRLVHIMPEYQSSQMELYAIFAPGKPVPPRIRLFVDHIAQAFARFRPSASNITGAQPTPMVV